MNTVYEPKKEVPVLLECDVLVAGAGVSGTAAALAAARNGARTILVECDNAPGGIATFGCVSAINNMLFAQNGTQVIGGIPAEIVNRFLQKESNNRLHQASDASWFCYDIESLKLILIEMLEEAGVTMLFHTFISDSLVENNKLRGVIVESKAGRQAVLAKCVVDATGDADVAVRAGVPFERRAFSHLNSDSFLFRLANIDLEETYRYLRSHPDYLVAEGKATVKKELSRFERDWELGFFILRDRAHSTLKPCIDKAVANGDFAREYLGCTHLDRLGMEGVHRTASVAINTGMFAIDNLNPVEVVKAEIVGRKVAFFVTGFLQKYLPGFEKAFVVTTATNLGIRFSRKIKAEYFCKIEDLPNQRFEDVIGCFKGFSSLVDKVIEIPYRSLVPQNIENLLVVSGKSFPINASPADEVRETPVCLVLGQAGGTAAALSAQQSVYPRKLAIQDLQKKLLSDGVYLGGLGEG